MSATYTVRQVAELLGYSTNSIYTFLKEKRIKGVRVGKGRFRIPKREVERLLMVQKNTGPQAVVDIRQIPPITIPLFGAITVITSNIFDWFLGIASVVCGLALFLFNQSFGVSNVQFAAAIVPAARIILIGGGLGILLTNLFYMQNRLWHKLFHALLCVVGIAMSIFFIKIGDWDGFVLYGSITLVTGLTMFVSMGRIASFAFLLTLLDIGAIVVPAVAPGDAHVVMVSESLHLAPVTFAVVMAIVNLLFIIFLWYGYFRSRFLFWLATWAAAATYFFFAFLYAGQLYWSRAFFLMIVGMTSLFLPFWEELSTRSERKVQLYAVAIFGSIFSLLVVSVAIIYFLQQNIFLMVEQEEVNKVTYAKMTLETAIDTVKSTATTAATDADLVAAVEASDTAVMTSTSRILFEGNRNIRRVVILDKNGHGLFLYPPGTFDRNDLSFREYFTTPRDTGRLYVSDVFESAVDQAHRKVVTVSVPMLTRTQKFVGVLAFSVDIDALAARLQKIAISRRGEYIVVLDASGGRIMHPDPSKIGTEAEQDDPARLGILGASGVTEGNTFDGKHSLTAYDTVNGLRWGINLKVPLVNVYQLSYVANMSVAAILTGSIIVGVLFLRAAHFWRRREGSGP